MTTFEPQGFSLQIFKDRYALTPEETWEEACRRLARQMILPETVDKMKVYEEKFYEVLVDNLFVPGGRVWRNSGRSNPQLLNCFLLTDELDTREGWGRISYEMIVTSMTGGGCGIDFSDVRPDGAEIKGNGGICPGPVELMELINGNAKPVISGGGRRVALMFSLDLDHPDVEKFLDYKLEQGKLSYANISVRSKNTSAFIKAVKNDGDWELSWKGKYKKTIKARALWDRIVKNAWNSAEPGFLNWEKVSEENTIYYLTDLASTNPCLPEDTWIQTTWGARQIRDLIQKPFTAILNGKKYPCSKGFEFTGVKPVFRIDTAMGYSVEATDNHRFFVNRDGEMKWEEVGNLEIGDNIVLSKNIREVSVDQSRFDRGWLVGEIVGDGGYNPDKYKGYVRFWGDHAETMANMAYSIANTLDMNYSSATEFKGSWLNTCNETWNVQSRRIDEFVLGLIEPGTKKILPNLEKEDDSFVLGFLRGFFDADGSIQGLDSPKNSVSIRLAQSDQEKLFAVQRILARFGIISTISKRRDKHMKLWPDGKVFESQEQFELIISKNCILLYDKLIGFYDPIKKAKLMRLISDRSKKRGFYEPNYVSEITNISYIEDKPVFDCTIDDDIHAFDANGFVSHNCGEVPMEKYSTCCLGHLVLPRFVKDGKIDYNLLGNTVRLGVRFLDNILDVNHFPIPEMAERSQKTRRIGLGTTGLADMLVLLGIRYGSDEAIEMCRKLYRFISKTAYEGSVMLAIEKGPFPLCNPKKHVESGFMRRMTKKIQSLVLDHGIRNCAILTQAPTGTVSILSNNCSSGIEPIFATAYERRFWQGKKRSTELVFHPLFVEYMKRGLDVSHFVSSTELSIRDHMEIQKIIQEHVDNGISKTINVAEDYPVEEMSSVWLEYLPHLKGTTFYRENSRGFVNAEGIKEEPPLVALTMEEAKRRFKEKSEAIVGGSREDCASGVCSL